jgi:hypothetical protein
VGSLYTVLEQGRIEVGWYILRSLNLVAHQVTANEVKIEAIL